jgi:hypothetical protein
MNNRIMTIGGTLLGLAVGAAAGYLVAKKRLEAKYEDAVKEEIIAAKKYYATLYKKDEYSTPSEAVKALKAKTEFATDEVTLNRIVAGLRYGQGGQRVETVDVLDNEEPEPGDYSAEDAARGPDRPYVLEVDEYMRNESDYAQATLTYYKEDDILADEDDIPITDVEALVGNDNLDKFGHRSGDPRVLYVRNEKIQMEYEIVKHDGSFAEEVGGFVQHEDRRRITHKFYKD